MTSTNLRIRCSWSSRAKDIERARASDEETIRMHVRHIRYGVTILGIEQQESQERDRNKGSLSLRCAEAKEQARLTARLRAARNKKILEWPEPSNIVESRIQGPKVWILESKVQGPRHGCNPCHTAPTCLFRAFGGLQTTEMVSKRCRKKKKNVQPSDTFLLCLQTSNLVGNIRDSYSRYGTIDN